MRLLKKILRIRHVALYVPMMLHPNINTCIINQNLNRLYLITTEVTTIIFVVHRADFNTRTTQAGTIPYIRSLTLI